MLAPLVQYELHLSDAKHALSCVQFIAIIGIAVSVLEDISRLRQFSSGGFLNWEVVSAERFGMIGSLQFRAVSILMRRWGMLVFLALQFAMCLVPLFFPFGSSASIAAWSVLLIGRWCLTYRSSLGLDGAHVMLCLVATSLFAASVFGAYSLVGLAALWFIALQSVLSYVASGIAKLKGNSWRSGTAIREILSANMYGNNRLFAFVVQYPGISRMACWATIAFEVCFFTVFIPGFGNVMLATGVAFHAFNSAVMGLNVFFWAFVCTYPAIIYCRTLTFDNVLKVAQIATGSPCLVGI